jgi:citrate lyase subunit beta/citryl-CoA lyase
MVREALPGLVRPNYLLVVRVNGLDTGLLEDDLLAVVVPALQGISLPKVDRPETIRQVDHYLTILEKERGIPPGQVKIIPWVESPQAVLSAEEICRASPRLLGASFGGEDFSVGMGIQRSKEGREVEWPRYRMALACRAAGILPIDTPYMDFRDLEQLEREARLVRSMGYVGKYCIHPSQVEVVNKVFVPTQEEIAQARRVVAAYEEGERRGVGAVAMDGLVVDRPVYVRAQALLELSQGGAGEAKG